MLTSALGPGEQEPLPQAVQRDTSCSGVAGVDIVIALGVVELFDAGRDDPISRHRLAVVDGRLGYVQAVGGFGRDILKNVLRKAAPDGLRDEAHDHAIAMGELQILVDPGLRLRGELRRELAGRKHHLMIAIRQVVAVHINIVELIIEPYLLGLLVHLKQRPRVPQTDVLDRVLISRDHLGRQVRQRRIGCFLDRVEL